MTSLNTNSGLGPGPGLIVPSPAGVLIRYNVTGWSQTGQGNFQPAVVSPVQGGISMAGTGDLSLSGYNVTGRQGTLDVVFTTGAPAAGNQLVAALVNTLPTPTGYIAILLDNLNRPFIVVTDVGGNTVASTEPIGDAFPAGTCFHTALEWNSGGAFNGEDFVVFEIGEVSEVNWGTAPYEPWTPFQPTALTVGTAFGSYLQFTGTIGNVQLGNGTPVYIPPVSSLGHEVSVGLRGEAVVIATGAAAHTATVSPIAGTSAVVARAAAHHFTSKTLAGEATFTATGKATHKAVVFPFIVGQATVTATATVAHKSAGTTMAGQATVSPITAAAQYKLPATIAGQATVTADLTVA
jgi:hypothetical protein